MKFLATLGLVSVAILVALWHAWILTLMWGWFVVPWTHLQQLSVGYAYGLCLIIGLVFAPAKQDKEQNPEDIMGKLFAALMEACLSGTLILGIAYITHLIIG